MLSAIDRADDVIHREDELLVSEVDASMTIVVRFLVRSGISVADHFSTGEFLRSRHKYHRGRTRAVDDLTGLRSVDLADGVVFLHDDEVPGVADQRLRATVARSGGTGDFSAEASTTNERIA